MMQKNNPDRKLQLFEDNEEVACRLTNTGMKRVPKVLDFDAAVVRDAKISYPEVASDSGPTVFDFADGVVRHAAVSYLEIAARYAMKTTSVTDINRYERKSEDAPKDTQEAASSLTTQPPTEVAATEMPYGSITPPPATVEPAEKQRHKAETVSATVRKVFFAGSGEPEIGPEAKKTQHD